MIIKYIFLGIIQGLTEFFPVSSSAHLVIFQDLLQIHEHQLLLDIMLHLGTLVALVVFFLKDIKYFLNKKIIFYLFSATAITALIVILGKDFFEHLFVSAQTLPFPLLVTGLILICTKKFSKGMRTLPNLRVTDALWLGLTQGLCVIPGLSRSGVTISTLLFRHVERETAFKFSFLVSLPAILGALVFKIDDFSGLSAFEFRYMILGLLASFFSGLLTLKALLEIIRQARLYLFGFYCWALALVLWIL